LPHAEAFAKHVKVINEGILEVAPLTIHQFSMLPIEEVRAGRLGGF
jgi:hypothetical protein